MSAAALQAELCDREVFAERVRGLPWHSDRWTLPQSMFVTKVAAASIASFFCLSSLLLISKDKDFIAWFLLSGILAAILSWGVINPVN